jgi:hypothetical protein
MSATLQRSVGNARIARMAQPESKAMSVGDFRLRPVDVGRRCFCRVGL